jgi:hypothetical protein
MSNAPKNNDRAPARPGPGGGMRGGPRAMGPRQPINKKTVVRMLSYLKPYWPRLIIVLACIIFSVFASSPPVVDPNAAAASMVWSYIGELIFNMLILVGSVKMADRIVREMLGL